MDDVADPGRRRPLPVPGNLGHAVDLDTYLRSDIPHLDANGRMILEALGSGLTDESAAKRLGVWADSLPATASACSSGASSRSLRRLQHQLTATRLVVERREQRQPTVLDL